MKVCVFYSRGPHYVRVLKALRARYPEARLVALVPQGFPGAAVETLVDEVDFMDGGIRGLRRPLALLAFLTRLRAGHYDVFVTMFDSTRLRLLARASGAREVFCLTLDGRFLPLRESLLMQALRALSRNIAGRIRYRRIHREVHKTSVRK